MIVQHQLIVLPTYISMYIQDAQGVIHMLCFDIYCYRHEERSQKKSRKQSEIRKCPACQRREMDVSVAFRDFGVP